MTTLLYSSLTLKLNACWQAIGYMTVKNTFNRLFTSQDTLRAIDIVIEPDGSISNQSQTYTGMEWAKLPVREGRDEWLGLSHGKIRIPLVVITPHFHTLPKVTLQFNKRGLYTRDRGICSYCGRLLTFEEATKDHIIPASKGGPTTWENCTLSCIPCNLAKADKSLADSGMILRRKPKVPGLTPILPELRAYAPPEHAALLRAGQ